MMQASITMVEERIKQVEDKMTEYKKKEAQEKFNPNKQEDPQIIGKTLISSQRLYRIEQQDKVGIEEAKRGQVTDSTAKSPV